MDNKVVLEIKDLKKYFGVVKALDGVDMKLHQKEIIAIVGDNVACKSTLIKTISGVYQKTGGSIIINGEEVHVNTPMDARTYGIEPVYQDQGLIPILDASLNIFLGREKIRGNLLGKLFKFTDDLYMKKETEELLPQDMQRVILI